MTLRQLRIASATQEDSHLPLLPGHYVHRNLGATAGVADDEFLLSEAIAEYQRRLDLRLGSDLRLGDVGISRPGATIRLYLARNDSG